MMMRAFLSPVFGDLKTKFHEKDLFVERAMKIAVAM